MDLPDGRPTEAQYADLCLQHQFIDECFYASARECGGQFDATMSIGAAMDEISQGIEEYLHLHAATVTAIETAISRNERRRIRARRRSATAAWLTHPARRARAAAAGLAGRVRGRRRSPVAPEEIQF